MRNLTNETILMEKFVIEILKQKNPKNIEHLNLKDKTSNVDIIIDGKKFDVKYANPTIISKKKRVPIWDFDLRKGEHKNKFHTDLDYFICVGLKYNTPKKIMMIPFIDAPKSHLRVSAFGKSKWHKYTIWES